MLMMKLPKTQPIGYGSLHSQMAYDQNELILYKHTDVTSVWHGI